jgi:signal transduction histidine kinase
VRRRLLTILLLLLSGLLAAVVLPLAQSYAAQRSQTFHITRLGDAARFAALSEEALRTGRPRRLTDEIVRYDRLYDVAVAIVDVDRTVVASSRPSVDLADPAVARQVDAALAGQASGGPPVIWPWNAARHVVAEPVGRDSQVIGAVVTLSATDDVRADVRDRLLLLLTLGLFVSAVLAALVALPLVRWILRPVNDLDAAAHEIAQGHLDVRVPSPGGPAELRGLATSFNTMADSVYAAAEQQRVFVSDASHQLRNPLAALRLRVENLRSHVDGDGRADLREALAETERLAGLVDALLRLARAEATRIEHAPVDLGACVRERVDRWAPHAPDTPVGVDVPAGTLVRARRDVVEQVVDVLLDNALKFAPGMPVDVTVAAAGDDVLLRVRDGGPGLSDEDLARVGERFFRSRAHQNVPGTGLGLAIARELAARAGGDLTVAHARPSGLAVTVRFPAAASRPSPSPPGSIAPIPDAAPGDRSRSPSAG